MPRLRCTHKLLKLLGKEATKIAREDDSDESGLDWYANLFYVEGQECLIFTNVGTLVSFVALDVQRNDIEDLLLFFRSRYRDLLGSLAATAEQIERELESFQDLSIGKSTNRKVLGSMNTLTREARQYVNIEGELAFVDQTALNAWLVRVSISELARRIPGLRSPSDFWKPDEQPPRNMLTEFLSMADCFAGDLGYFGLRGFLFAVLTSPELVMPSEWKDVLLASDEPVFADDDEAMEVLGLLNDEYNSVNQAILDGVGVRAEDCRLRDDAMANFDPSAPAGMWSRGFMFGFELLSDVWDAAGTEEDVEYVRGVADYLTFFAYRQLSIEESENQGTPESKFGVLAELARAKFHDAARAVAGMGRRESISSKGDGAPVRIA